MNHEIAVVQKYRDDSRRRLGPEYDPARVKEEEQLSAIHHERFYSVPSAEARLP